MTENAQISERQKQILFAIIEEYAETALPVGSVTLAKLFGVSSATIRAEMVRLEELKYLAQPHTSAGRVPTDAGYRFYVNSLSGLNQSETALTEPDRKFERSARAIEARVQTHLSRADQAIRSAVDSLVELTGNLGIATIGEQLYIAGMSSLFAQPEFFDRSRVEAVARLLDNLEPLLREAEPNQPLNVFIGNENPIGKTSGASLIISRFRSPFSDKSYIGILGPTRQSYAKVMKLVKHTGAVLEEVL